MHSAYTSMPHKKRRLSHTCTPTHSHTCSQFKYIITAHITRVHGSLSTSPSPSQSHSLTVDLVDIGAAERNGTERHVCGNSCFPTINNENFSRSLALALAEHRTKMQSHASVGGAEGLDTRWQDWGCVATKIYLFAAFAGITASSMRGIL